MNSVKTASVWTKSAKLSLSHHCHQNVDAFLMTYRIFRGSGVLEHARLPIPTAGQILAQFLTEFTEIFDPRVKKKFSLSL